jgi:hypothetical protein
MAISEFWKPIITWSWAAIAIAENGPILIMISATLLLLTLIWLIYIEINKRKVAKNLYAQISDSEERQIFDAIKAVEKGLVNESKIVSKYREISKRDIDLVKLHRKLVEAEEAGLIERKIININDEPFITWKLNF